MVLCCVFFFKHSSLLFTWWYSFIWPIQLKYNNRQQIDSFSFALLRWFKWETNKECEIDGFLNNTQNKNQFHFYHMKNKWTTHTHMRIFTDYYCLFGRRSAISLSHSVTSYTHIIIHTWQMHTHTNTSILFQLIHQTFYHTITIAHIFKLYRFLSEMNRSRQCNGSDQPVLSYLKRSPDSYFPEDSNRIQANHFYVFTRKSKENPLQRFKNVWLMVFGIIIII